MDLADRLTAERSATAISMAVLGAEIERLSVELVTADARSVRWESECRHTDADRAELVRKLEHERNRVAELETVVRELRRAADTKPEIATVAAPPLQTWWCADCSTNVMLGKACALCRRAADGKRVRRGRK